MREKIAYLSSQLAAAKFTLLATAGQALEGGCEGSIRLQKTAVEGCFLPQISHILGHPRRSCPGEDPQVKKKTTPPLGIFLTLFSDKRTSYCQRGKKRKIKIKVR